MNNRGKRMVQEDELKYLQNLKEEHPDPSAEWGGGGGGSSYEAGNGITIADETISVNYGAGLTVDDETLVVDTDTIALKSELATVATTGDYDDLTNKPDIPEAPLVLTQATGTLTDEQYTSLDENTVVQYHESSSGITRLYYFYSDTTTQIEYRTNPIFKDSIIGNVYRFIVTKADKSYGLNYSMGNRLLPVPSSDGTSRLICVKSGSTVNNPTWKLDYPDPDTTTAGTYNLEATVDSQGGVTYDWATGGGGSSYTFTNGLTENAGTVSWDLNDKINLNTATSGTLTTSGFGMYFNNDRKNLMIDANNGSINQGSTVTNYSVNNILYGKANKINGNNSSNNVLIGHDITTYSNSSSGNIIIGGYNTTDIYGSKYCNLFGQYLAPGKDHQTILGEYNLADNSSIFILGNGASSSTRSNAMTVSADGTIVSKNLPAVDTTTDGTYVLEATVSSGVVTYAWVLKS